MNPGAFSSVSCSPKHGAVGGLKGGHCRCGTAVTLHLLEKSGRHPSLLAALGFQAILFPDGRHESFQQIGEGLGTLDLHRLSWAVGCI